VIGRGDTDPVRAPQKRYHIWVHVPPDVIGPSQRPGLRLWVPGSLICLRILAAATLADFFEALRSVPLENVLVDWPVPERSALNSLASRTHRSMMPFRMSPYRRDVSSIESG